MKSTLPIVLLALIVGLVLGFFVRPAYTALRQKQATSALSGDLAVSFDRCNDAPVAAAKACTDSVLFDEAVRTQRTDICEAISNAGVKQDCLSRVELITSLGKGANVCASLSTSAACPDVMNILLATETHDVVACNRIASQSLLQACVRLVSGTDLEGEYGDGKVVRSNYTYGFTCDRTIPECVNDVRAFNSAVRQGSPSSCDTLTTQADRCRTEAVLYQAYTSGDMAACVAALSEAQCQYEVTLAKALDAGNVSLCSTLSADLQQGCKLVIESNKEKRFEYLNEKF
jgi:hypothetical protein